MSKQEKIDELMQAIESLIYVAVGHHQYFGGYYVEDVDEEAYDEASNNVKEKLTKLFE